MEKTKEIGAPLSNERAVRESEKVLWEHAAKTCVNTKRPGVKQMKTKARFRVRKRAQAGLFKENCFGFWCKDAQEAKEMAHQEFWDTHGEPEMPRKTTFKGLARRGKGFKDEPQSARQMAQQEFHCL
jgi:hypothetical protein